jgi:IclR family acetate operon transcriptional repressor
VESGGRRRWTLTARVLTLARQVQPAPDLREHALAAMEALRTRTGETIHLTLRDGDHVVLIERLDSPQPLRTVRPLGARAHLHLGSSGKSILAAAPQAEQAAYLARDLRALTPRTLADPADLARDLEAIARRGYALNDGELDLAIRAVGAAIVLPSGEPVAALSISCPASRFPDSLIDTYGALVRAAATDVSRRLAHRETP